MKVRTNKVPKYCYYIIPGKEYKLIERDYEDGVLIGGSFIAEGDLEVYVYIPSSFHLDGAAWEVID